MSFGPRRPSGVDIEHSIGYEPKCRVTLDKREGLEPDSQSRPNERVSNKQIEQVRALVSYAPASRENHLRDIKQMLTATSSMWLLENKQQPLKAKDSSPAYVHGHPQPQPFNPAPLGILDQGSRQCKNHTPLTGTTPSTGITPERAYYHRIRL